MKLLVTGGAGFIGSNFIRMVLTEHPSTWIINLDKLTYAGNRKTIADILSHPRHKFVQGDIADQTQVNRLFAQEEFDAVVNFAAESHVDRSIDNPSVFIRSNIVGVQVLLDAACKYGVPKFVQISTDEVYGSLGPTGLFTESSPLKPSSPYSASKTSADHLVMAWHHTYGLHVNITRCSNNYGPYQFPEKLIPVMISKALKNEKLPVFGDGTNVRDWIHVMDHCRGIWAVLQQGRNGRVYNIGSNNERSNLAIVTAILDILEKPHSLISFVNDRPGHDWRYAIDADRLHTELGWIPQQNFATGLLQTIKWYTNNPEWLI